MSKIRQVTPKAGEMFDAKTPLHRYRMLIESFDEFVDDPSNARRAFDCAVAAVAVRDWVWGGWLVKDDAARETLGVADRKAFVAWVTNSSLWFELVRQLANGSKHLTAPTAFVPVKVVAAPFSFDRHGAGFSQGAWEPLVREWTEESVREVSGPLPVGRDGKGVLVLDLGEGDPANRWLPVEHVLEAVVRFWRDFFRRFHNPTEVPVSRHRID